MRKMLTTLFVVLAIGLVSSAMAAEQVKLSGSTSVQPLASSWGEAFDGMQSDYTTVVSGGGSGAGITNVATGLSDIGMASRKVKESEIESYGDEFIEHVVAKDCICIVVSEPIYDAGVTDLSQDQVKQIYNGDITNWAEVGGPDEDIYVVSRGDASGTKDYFMEHFFGSSSAEAPGVSSFETANSGVATAVARSDKAIGFVALNYINADGLVAVALDGVTPSIETAQDGSYPVVRDLYMYTFGETGAGAQAFLDFALSDEGQDIAEEMGYPPVE